MSTRSVATHATRTVPSTSRRRAAVRSSPSASIWSASTRRRTPSATSRTAIASPMPWAAPVTRAESGIRSGAEPGAGREAEPVLDGGVVRAVVGDAAAMSVPPRWMLARAREIGPGGRRRASVGPARRRPTPRRHTASPPAVRRQPCAARRAPPVVRRPSCAVRRAPSVSRRNVAPAARARRVRSTRTAPRAAARRRGTSAAADAPSR